MFFFSLVILAGGWMFFGPGPSEPDQASAVKSTVDSYVRAFAKGDGKKACDQLNDSAREAVIGMSGRIGATDCPTAMEKTREIGGDKVRSIASEIRVRKVHVTGGTARVTLRSAGLDSVAELERVGKDWKISSLPRS